MTKFKTALDWGHTTEERNSNIKQYEESLKVNKYTELKSKHERLINDFPMGFAFSDKQFEEVKEKLHVTDNSELMSITSGGIIRKSDSKAFKQLFHTMDKETEEALKDDEYLFQGFLYELGNHEYCITYDPEATLDCFGLTVEEVQSDERLLSIFNKARKEYLSYCEY